MKQFIYTNIGFEPTQYKVLKHLAVERHLPLSELIRQILTNRLRQEIVTPKRWSQDYFFRFGPLSSHKLHQVKKINPHDKLIYGL